MKSEGKSTMESVLKKKKTYIEIGAFYALTLPEYDMQMHRHPRFEIMYVTKNKCYVYVNDQELCLREQQFIYLNADVPHRLFIPEGHPCSILNLEFSTPDGEEGIDITELLQECPSCAAFFAQSNSFFVRNDTGNLGYALKDLIYQLESSVPFRHTTLKAKAVTAADHQYLLRLLLQRTLLELATSVSQQTQTAGMAYLKKACAYITDHLTEEIRIPQLAAHTGINKSYLQSLFAKYMDCTITDYINRRRLEQAVFLLTNSSLSVTDIAFRSGYNSRQHFGSTFEKYYKLSPRSYRQLHGKTMEPSTGENFYYKTDGSAWNKTTLTDRSEPDTIG